MSFHAVTAALTIQGLEPTEKFLLVVLASYANTDNTLWPSQRRLAEDTSMGERTVRRHLATLEQRGLIKREMRRSGERRTSDFIKILCLPANLAARGRLTQRQPAKNDRSTGQIVQSEPANLAGKPVIEPRKEPSHARARETEGAARVLVELPSLQRRVATPKPNETPAQMAARLRASAA